MIDEKAIVNDLQTFFTGRVKNKTLFTYQVRKKSSEIFREIKSWNYSEIIGLAERLLEIRKWEYGVIAYDLAYRIRNSYDDKTFNFFESWLFRYVKGWGDCDDFCTHAFGALLAKRPEHFSKIKLWTKSESFPVRRAAAVILIYAIRNKELHGIDPFEIADLLSKDKNTLVQKGCGWMLKVYSELEPEKVFNYLRDKHEVMSRVTFRYAMEKMSSQKKSFLMKQGTSQKNQ